MKTYYNKDEVNIRLDLVEDLIEKDFLNKDELRRANRYYYHPNGVRRCSKCQEVKTANSDNFYVKRHYRDELGNVLNIGLSGNCIPCDKIRLAKDKSRQRQDPELYCNRLIASLRSRAKEQDVPFNLTGEELHNQLLIQGIKCFYTGGVLNFDLESVKGTSPNRYMPSVDKLTPALGYIKENVVWAYYYVNRMKNDLNLEEFIELCKTVLKNTTPE